MAQIIDCPKCGEGDERHLGHNICPLCECKFWVRPSGEVFVPDREKRISLQDALKVSLKGLALTRRLGEP